MEDEDANDDGEEARQDPNDVHGWQSLPLLEEHCRREDDAGREEDIVDGGDQRSIEDV